MSVSALVKGRSNRTSSSRFFRCGSHRSAGRTTGATSSFLGPTCNRRKKNRAPTRNPWDESFFVIRGEVDFSLGDDEARMASVGTLVHVPAGAKHWFRWRPGGGAMLSITSRTGASEMFTDIHAEIAPDQPNVERLMAIAARHGLATWAG